MTGEVDKQRRIEYFNTGAAIVLETDRLAIPPQVDDGLMTFRDHIPRITKYVMSDIA